ncbi:hypothetical protein ABK040_006051 [Willaertia magna]
MNEHGELNALQENNTTKPTKSRLKLFLMTWNMQGLPSPEEDYVKSIIPLNNHHIYCIGTQECERSIGTSVIIESKQRWEKTLNNVFGKDYFQVQSCTLVAIHIIIFVRKELIPQLSDICVSSVATGWKNQIGNKGGVSISFKLGKNQYLFINNHLPAHDDKVKERNESFERILTEIDYVGKEKKKNIEQTDERHTSETNKESHGVLSFIPSKKPHVIKDFAFIFVMGDLNYRVKGNRKVVDKVLEMKELNVLLSNDQLTIERKKKDNIWSYFEEGEITFLPTYKFEKNSETYDQSKKQRIPSYTDRILFKPSKKISLEHYDSISGVKYSDHRPVCATFSIDAKGIQLEIQDETQDSVSTSSSVCLVQ